MPFGIAQFLVAFVDFPPPLRRSETANRNIGHCVASLENIFAGLYLGPDCSVSAPIVALSGVQILRELYC